MSGPVNPAVEWLEALFERRWAYRERLPIPGLGYRPMFELVAQDDTASWASWPDPMPDDDLDEWDAEYAALASQGASHA